MLQQLKRIHYKPLMRYKLAILLILSSTFIYFYLIQHFKHKPPNEFYILSAYLLENESEKNTVRLIAMGPQQEVRHSIVCQNQNGDVVEASVEVLGGPASCRWWNYFIDCNFDKPSTSLQIFNDEEYLIKIPIRKPKSQVHELVVCFGRMFLFENWRVALTAIEVYRAHGVNMFNIPIISVIDAFYNVLKAYEQAGIVRLTSGVILPRILGDYDPNQETEFFNQVVSNTECLYEFRNSKFLIFADFDDILIPKNHFDLYQEMLAIQFVNPLASSFEFWRDPNTKIVFEKEPRNFNLDQSASQIQLARYRINPGKTVIIPSRIRNGFIHKPASSDLIDSFVHLRMNETDANFLHLGSVFDKHAILFNQTSYVNQIRYSSLQQSLNQVLNLNKVARQSFNFLPIKDTYFQAMNQCHLEIAEKLRNGTSFCPNALQCRINQTIELPTCARLHIEYSTVNLQDRLLIHQPISNRIRSGIDCQI